jgi:hypothetical protein
MIRLVSVWLGVILAVAVLPGGSSATFAQMDTAVGGGGSGGGFYDYTNNLPGPPMEVNIWGGVHRTGHYKVPSSTTLVELISLAGGPLDRAAMNRVKVIRDAAIDSTIRDVVVYYDMLLYQQTGDAKLNPILYPNSTIVIDVDTAPSSFTEILAIVANVATITLSIVGIYISLKTR